MRATVNPDNKHAVDGVLPGREGDFVDNRSTRALVAAGVLRPLDALPPEPPPKPSKAPLVGGGDDDARRLREEFMAAWESREAEVRAERKRAAEELAAASAERDRLAAESAQLRAELDAIRAAAAPKGKAKAKAGEEPPTEKAEG